ncbi:MAG: TonB-dependent receptor [Vicinamibacteria bacterium]|nr:TonB-dependent receptor [Vicinamibacteria bacterium]
MKSLFGRTFAAAIVTGSLILAASPARATTETEVQDVRGEVRDSLSGAPLPGVEVRLDDQVVVTDALGQFTVRRGPPPHRFILKAKGQSQVVRSVSEVESLSTVILLLDPPLKREERVEVFDVQKDDPAPASIPIRPEQVLQVAGAVDNIFRALQTLPGVAATDEFGSRLAVRGGTPDQNLTLMDGVEIHNPYRLFGLTSAFNPETVEKFELSAGAFSARYGDRLSSILLVENRDGLKDRGFQGSTTLSITDGNLLFEGPWRNRDKGSWIVSARRTYYDLIADRIVGEDLPGFQDVQFRGNYEASPSTRLTLFGTRSRESGDATFTGDGSDSGSFANAATNDVYGVKARTFFGARLSSTLALAYYDFGQTLKVDAQFEDGSRRSNARVNTTQINVAFDQTIATRDFSLRNDWSYALSPANLLEAGFEAHRLRTGATYNISGERNLSEANPSSNRGGAALPDRYDEQLPSNRWGVWVQDRMTMGKRLSSEAGLRLSRSSITGNVEVEPRLSLLFRGGDTWRWRAAYGSHSQSPGIEKLLQSDYFLDLSTLGLRNERSRHATLTFEKDFTSTSLKGEAYYKNFSDLIVGALETDAELAARLARYDFPASLRSSIPAEKLITTRPANGASGRSWGFELVATRPQKNGDQFLSGWASYGYGKATKDAYGRSLPFEYDRRHSLSIVSQLNASEKVQIGITFRASSGFARTAPLGVRVVPTEDTLDADKDGNTSELVPERDSQGLPVYTADYGSVGNLLNARYPRFVRLDMRVNWRPRGLKSRWLFYLEFINVTNRENVGRYEATLRPNAASDRPRIEETPTAALPFLPTFGVRFRF